MDEVSANYFVIKYFKDNDFALRVMIDTIKEVVNKKREQGEPVHTLLSFVAGYDPTYASELPEDMEELLNTLSDKDKILEAYNEICRDNRLEP